MKIKFVLHVISILMLLSIDCFGIEYDIISLNPKGQEKAMIARGAKLAKDGTVVGTLHSYRDNGTPKTSIFIYNPYKDYQILSQPFLDENTDLVINQGDILVSFSRETRSLFAYHITTKEWKHIDLPINPNNPDTNYQIVNIVGITKHNHLIVEINAFLSSESREYVCNQTQARVYDCNQSQWLDDPMITCKNDTLIMNSQGQMAGHGAYMWFYDPLQGSLNILDYEEYLELKPEMLSENGVIFGSCQTQRNGFYWSAEQGIKFINPAGIKHITFLSPRCSNKHGQAVFRGVHKGKECAYIFDSINGTVVDLKNLGGTNSWPWSINKSRQVVGESEIRKDELRAFIWDPVNKIRDLNTLIPSQSGWILNWAIDINDQGYIIGYGIYKKEYQNFLLIPRN